MPEFAEDNDIQLEFAEKGKLTQDSSVGSIKPAVSK